MTGGARSTLVAFIVLLGFLARAATYKAPLLDHHGWRQADTASIARNFASERFNILYPQIDQRGDRPTGYVETGFELFAFAVAAIAKVAGFHAEIGRILAAFCFIGSCLLVRAFVRRRDGDETAMVAAALYAFGYPLMFFMERAFMNEALLVMLSLACLVSAQRYLASRGALDLVALIAASTLIALIKLPYLIVWAPIAGLFIEEEGIRVWRRWELLALATVNVIPAFFWYRHAHVLALQSGLSFGLTDKLFDAGTVFSLQYPVLIVTRLARDVLGPIGVAAVAIGTRQAWGKRRWCELLGVAGFVAYLVIVSGGNLVHDYYQIAFVPTAALIAAPGLVSAANWQARGARAGRESTIIAVLVGVAILSTFVRFVSAHGWFEYEARDVVLCETLRQATAPADRLLIIGDNNPMWLFCAERKGWALSAEESTASRVQAAQQSGAALAVLIHPAERPGIRQLLSETGRLIATDGRVEVYAKR